MPEGPTVVSWFESLSQLIQKVGRPRRNHRRIAAVVSVSLVRYSCPSLSRESHTPSERTVYCGGGVSKEEKGQRGKGASSTRAARRLSIAQRALTLRPTSVAFQASRRRADDFVTDSTWSSSFQRNTRKSTYVTFNIILLSSGKTEFF